MVEGRVYSGQMNSRVEIFGKNIVKNAAGEAVEELQSLGFKMVKRIDGSGQENEDGRLLSLAVCRFQMRFNAEIAANASTLIVRDIDGDWDVIGPMRLLDARRRYLELRCRKRGES